MKTTKPFFYLLLIFLASTSLSLAQFDHLLYQVPDSLLGNNAFLQLENHSDLNSQALWDRARPNLDFSLYQGASDAPSTIAGAALQAYWDIKHSVIDTGSFIPLDSMLALYKN